MAVGSQTPLAFRPIVKEKVEKINRRNKIVLKSKK